MAEILEWPFVEMDGVIEDRARKSIPEIFQQDGETYFRNLESKILAEVADRGGRVVSTGGGVPIREQNREIMKSSGLVIRLSASPEVIHKRLISSSAQRGRVLRPLLGDDAPLKKLIHMLEEREAAYSTAEITINTENKTHNEVAEVITAAWQTNKLAASNG